MLQNTFDESKVWGMQRYVDHFSLQNMKVIFYNEVILAVMIQGSSKDYHKSCLIFRPHSLGNF